MSWGAARLRFSNWRRARRPGSSALPARSQCALQEYPSAVAQPHFQPFALRRFRPASATGRTPRATPFRWTSAWRRTGAACRTSPSTTSSLALRVRGGIDLIVRRCIRLSHHQRHVCRLCGCAAALGSQCRCTGCLVAGYSACCLLSSSTALGRHNRRQSWPALRMQCGGVDTWSALHSQCFRAVLLRQHVTPLHETVHQPTVACTDVWLNHASTVFLPRGRRGAVRG